MKSALTLILVVIFSWLPFEWAHASNLRYVRAGEHGVFTRVVFEFQATIRSKEPIITGKGTFSVVFLDVTTPIPIQTFHKITKGVHSVELVREESRLTANIKLSFPYFRLKTSIFSNPDRVVIDAYRMSSPPKISKPKESLHAKSNSRVLTEPAVRARIASTKKTSTEIEDSHFKIDNLTIKKPLLNETPERAEEISGDQEPSLSKEIHGTSSQRVSQVSAKQDKSLISFNLNYSVHTYLLVLLNIFTFIIIVLLSFYLLKSRSMDDSEHLNEILESLKTTDESIATIETMINRELKKIEHS